MRTKEKGSGRQAESPQDKFAPFDTAAPDSMQGGSANG